jgi:cation transport ATPase
MIVRLRTGGRCSLGVTLFALVGSGLAWLGAHYARADDLARIAQEALAMKVHGAAAMAMLVALGAMAAAHARPAWRARRNRTTGIAVVVAFAFLAATGYALYYLVSDETRPPVSLLHWTVGIALAAMLPVHVALGRRDA